MDKTTNGLLAYYMQGDAEESVLPDGYIHVGYIRSTGTQYIDTLVDMDNSLTISGSYRHFQDRYPGGMSVIDGRCRTADNKFNVIFVLIGGYGTDTQAFYGLSGSRLNMLVSNTNDRWSTFELKRNSFTVNGVTSKRTEPALAEGYRISMYLFAGHHYANGVDSTINLYPDSNMALDIGKLRIVKDGLPLRDYVACVRTADGRAGLYDLCGSVCPLTGSPFYINSGDGGDFEYVSGLDIMSSLGYVTDGLVECWDGEYNGGATHLGSSWNWYGMLKGTRLDYEGYDNYAWDDKCCHFAGNSGYARFTRSWNSDQVLFAGTLENCCSWSTLTGKATYPSPNCRVVYGRAGIGPTKSLTNVANGVTLVAGINGYQKNSDTIIPADAIVTLSATQAQGANVNAYKLYQNVEECRIGYNSNTGSSSYIYLIGNGDLSNAADTGGEGRVYCVRAYNRVLSAAELQQNRDVDIARFGTVVQ